MSDYNYLTSRIETRLASIGIIGLGYVGLPLALEFAKQGFCVTGFDTDSSKLKALNDGQSYIEDIPSDTIMRAITSQEEFRFGAFRTSDKISNLSTLDVICICVPTPLTRTKDPDLSHLARTIEEIKPRLQRGQLIILGSTTYPGTTHDLFVPQLEESGFKVGKDFFLAFSPERIDPGNKLFSLQEVPKVVGGETPKCTELAVKLFQTVFLDVVPVSSSQSAEMVKLLENTFRAINIGLVNEVALMCERLDLDVWEVIEAAATKPYGFMKFLPGPGLGGHCIPIDPSYLSWKMKSLNFPARFIDLATDINGKMPEHVVRKTMDILNQKKKTVNGSNLLILGIAYKADVGDLRESPALEIIKGLKAKGASIIFHDPHIKECVVNDKLYQSADLTDELLAAADLVILLTNHNALDYNRIVDKSQHIFDTRNAISVKTEKVTKL